MNGMYNKKTNSRTVVRVGMVCAAVLFVTMAVLTVVLIVSIVFGNGNVGETGSGEFDLDGITAERLSDTMDFSRYLLPEFIGFVSGDEMLGVSGSANTAKDIMCSLAELFSRLITHGNLTHLTSDGEKTGDEWFAGIIDNNTSYIYIRMHGKISDAVFGTFCDMYSGVDHRSEWERMYTGADIYEIILLPYSDASGSISAAVSDGEGNTALYTFTGPEATITTDDIDNYIMSYKSSLTTFEFAKDKYDCASYTEPVFSEPLYTKSLIITSSTAVMLKDSPSELKQVQSIFNFNPDKLISSRESSVKLSLADTQGILSVYNSAIEYTANDSGIPVSDILGYGAEYTEDYIAAAVKLFSNLREVSNNYTGGDAEIMLTSMSAENDTVELEFSYFYDNIRITGCEPALKVTFEDGSLTYARLYTIAVRNLGDRNTGYDEWWFLSCGEVAGKGIKLHDCALAYRCDTDADTVKAEWRGEY